MDRIHDIENTCMPKFPNAKKKGHYAEKNKNI